VVRGTVHVTCGEQVLLFTANQSVYIPIGEKHRLENPGENICEIIEVQSGDLMSEDDIERFDDLSGR
jgi:mannose-1-phosphate guanylyltransferase/mannose-6-phosphate isomerase